MTVLTPPANRGVRGTDAYGSGAYGASRDSGLRKHLGVDLIVQPGDSIYCPAACVVTMHGIAYANQRHDEPRYRTIRLEATEEDGLQFRILYMLPTAPIGTAQEAGAVLGTAQDLSAKYPGITPHVHFEMRRNGLPVDPTPYIVVAT